MTLLANPDFRRLFAGRLVTNAGDSLYAVAAMWLMFSLNVSTAYTGLAGFLTMGPQALQAFVGPLGYPLRRVLVASQAAQGLLVPTIPAAAALDVLSAPVVLVVMPLGALAGGLAGAAVGAEAVMVAGGLGFAWIVVYTAAVPSLRRPPR